MFTARMGFVAQIGCRTILPLPQTDSSHGLCDRFAKHGIAIEHGDAKFNEKLGNLVKPKSGTKGSSQD